MQNIQEIQSHGRQNYRFDQSGTTGEGRAGRVQSSGVQVRPDRKESEGRNRTRQKPVFGRAASRTNCPHRFGANETNGLI